jgi:pSer/pThr/pTyr-binding forkhead associated (FHA) protein
MGATRSGLILTVTAGNASGTDIHVEDALVIGRHADGVGQLGDDDELSRRHALISRTPAGEYVIQDLGSTNGTYVNGQRITEPAALAVGDTLELGNTILLVQSTGGGASPANTITSEQVAAVPKQPQPRVTVRIEIDVDRGVASIALDEGSDRVDLVHEAGRWRIDTPD